MKLPNPYKCDYCGTIKGTSNHWWIHTPMEHSFILLGWDDATADQEDITHICGEQCAGKALGVWMKARQEQASTKVVDRKLGGVFDHAPGCRASEYGPCTCGVGFERKAEIA